MSPPEIWDFLLSDGATGQSSRRRNCTEKSRLTFIYGYWEMTIGAFAEPSSLIARVDAASIDSLILHLLDHI